MGGGDEGGSGGEVGIGFDHIGQGADGEKKGFTSFFVTYLKL